LFGQFSGGEMSFSHQFLDQQCSQQACRPANHKWNPPRSQQMQKMVPIIVHTFVAPLKCSHSHVEVPLWKQNKIGTWNLEPYTPVCFARYPKSILGEWAGLALISSTFSSVSSQHLDSVLFLSNNSPVCLNLFIIIWIVFYIWNYNVLKCIPKSSPFSTCEYCMWTLVSLCNSCMAFDTKSNVTHSSFHCSY
jgi:hypothetical protein